MKSRLASGILTLTCMIIPLFCNAQQTIGMFTKNYGQQDGYVLFSAPSSETYLIDKCGKLIHKWNTDYPPGDDAYLLPNGNLLSTATVSTKYFSNGASDGGMVQIFDWNGNLVWRYTISDSIKQQDHDIYPMPNGNILVLEWDRHVASESIAFGRDSAKLKGSELWGVRVQEIKPIGKDSAQVVWDWRIWDHLIQDVDSTKPNYGVVANHPELLNINYTDPSAGIFSTSDWIHANAVTYNPDLDQVMISSRSNSEIYIIDHSTTTKEASSHNGGKHGKGGDFLYRWGNPAAYNRGTKTNRTLYVQHNPSWIPAGYPGAGNITVFNDGTGRPGGNYSTADIFAPPVDSKGNYYLDTSGAYGPASSYWSYKAANPTSFYSSVMGGVQRLQNGNMLIDESIKGNFFEVDSNKNLVWRYVNPDGGSGPLTQGTNPGNNPCYRANLYTEDYPAFKNKTLTPGYPIELKPYTYNCFMQYNLYMSPFYKIGQLKGYNAVTGIADSLNKGRGFIKGVVESPNLGATNVQFSLIDNTGAITITANKLSYTPSIGDSLTVSGSVNQVYGLIGYAADTVLQNTTGLWEKQPDIVSGLSESNQSNLIELINVWMTNKAEWVAKGNGFVVHITNGKDTFMMYVSSKTDLFKSKPLTEEFNVTGIEIQNQAKSPFFGNYEIEPRGSFDIQRVPQLYKIRQLRGQNQVTGISDSAGSINNFYLKGIVQSPDFINKGLNFSLKDSTGSIMVVSPNDISSYVPAIGDSMELRGLIAQTNGLIEVIPDSISILKNARPIIKPVIVSALSEMTEARLVKLNAVHLVDLTQWNPSGNSFNVRITNGTDTFIMVINSTIDLFKMNAIQGSFNLTGIEIQNQPNTPYLGNYEIEPRGFFDIERYTPLYKIIQLRTQNATTGVADSAGSNHPFFIKGIVQSPDFSVSGLNFSMKDNTGSIIVVSNADVSGYIPAVGDSIELRGLLIQNNGLTEVITDSVSVLSQKATIPQPINVPILSEAYESQLVKLYDCYLTDKTQWISNGNGFSVNITNGTDTFGMFISKNCNLFNISAPVELFNVTGIEIQSKSTVPYFGNYIIEPRNIQDLQKVTQLYDIKQIRSQDPSTGIADSSGNKTPFLLKGIVQSPNLTSSGYIFSLHDSTGSIIIFSTGSVSGYKPVVGDSIELQGLVMQFSGLTTVIPDSIHFISNSQQVIIPDFVSTLAEPIEAHLIQLDHFYLADKKQWTQKGNGFNVNITNGRDTFSMLISNATDLYKMKAPLEVFNVSGIEMQAKSASPYFGNYEIEPRGSFDLKRVVQLYKIRQVRSQNPVSGIADSAGSPTDFYVKGIVQSPDFINSGYQFSLKDSTGAIFIEDSQTSGNYIPNVGDSIEVHGFLNQIKGLTIVSTDSIVKLTSSNSVISPVNVTILNEHLEANLVKYFHGRLVDPSQWTSSGSGFSVDVTDGIDTIQIYISGTTDIFKMPAPSGEFNVTGIESQDKSSSPYLGNYFIMPRSISDFQLLKYPLYKIREIKGYNTQSGIADSTNTYCYLKGIVQSGNLSGYNKLFYALQDSTGAITVTSDMNIDGYSPSTGDSIMIRGIIKQDNGLIHIDIDSISKLSTGNEIAPIMSSRLGEGTESDLVMLKGYSLIDATKWDTTGAKDNFIVEARNGIDTITISVVRGTSLFSNSKAPNYNFDITGIGSQNDASLPYLSGYFIIPRSIADIEHSSSIQPLISSESKINVIPNPASGFVMIQSVFNIDRIQISDMVGKIILEQGSVNTKAEKLNINYLTKGIYFVKVYNGINYETVKLIKE